jgi:hypothetical protein
MRLTPSFLASSSAPLPPQAQVWDCFNRAQAITAAFEVHEVALHSGFMPDEATMLSLTLAELATHAVEEARGGVASVFFGAHGWRLEVSDASTSSSRPELRSIDAHAVSLRVVPRVGGKVIVAEYEREAQQRH